MIGAWLLPIVSAGVLGSLHCVGMCGGLVAIASEGSSGLKSRLAVQASYQLARLASYVTLGLAAGLLGHALDLAGEAAGLGKTAAVVAGVTMLAWGALAMLRAAGVKLASPQLRLPSALTSWLADLQRRPPLLRAGLLGGASALLPCGFLYAFALAAASTGSALGGALVMAALWAGNLPALLGFGLALGSLLAGVRRHLPLLSAAAILVLGFSTLTSRVNVPAVAVGSALGKPMPADCPYHRKPAP
jgi:sulfite exporter TauE/SafE